MHQKFTKLQKKKKKKIRIISFKSPDTLNDNLFWETNSREFYTFFIKYVKEALEGTREQALCNLFTIPPQIHNHATRRDKNNLTIFLQFNIAVYGTQAIWSQSVLIWNMFRNLTGWNFLNLDLTELNKISLN